MDKQTVIDLIVKELGIKSTELTEQSVADDFVEWDSMGTLSIITMLQEHGITFDPGDAEKLLSVQGILQTFRDAGRLEP